MHASKHHLHILNTMADRAPAATTWAMQWDDLKTMWNAGMPTEQIGENLNRSVSAVLTQAARLGLARRAAPGRKAKTRVAYAPKTNVIAFKTRDDAAQAVEFAPRQQKQARICLMCSTSFNSHGSHNRICPRCKAGSAYQVGHDDTYKIMSA